jgi:hypothetical protein
MDQNLERRYDIEGVGIFTNLALIGYHSRHESEQSAVVNHRGTEPEAL